MRVAGRPCADRAHGSSGGDPAAANTMTVGLASALAPLNDELTGLFRPEEDDQSGSAPPGTGDRHAMIAGREREIATAPLTPDLRGGAWSQAPRAERFLRRYRDDVTVGSLISKDSLPVPIDRHEDPGASVRAVAGQHDGLRAGASASRSATSSTVNLRRRALVRCRASAPCASASVENVLEQCLGRPGPGAPLGARCGTFRHEQMGRTSTRCTSPKRT